MNSSMISSYESYSSIEGHPANRVLEDFDPFSKVAPTLAANEEPVSSADASPTTPTPLGRVEYPIRFAVRSLGWVTISERDLTPERSSKAVNRCIVELSLGRNNFNDVVGRWGDVSAFPVPLPLPQGQLLEWVLCSFAGQRPVHGPG